MSKRINQSAFTAYYEWQRLDRLGRPIDLDRAGFTQPDTITITHMVDGRENSVHIVPDQTIFRPEWALFYTIIPGFKENLLNRSTLEGHVIYSTFAKCLAGNPQITWKELLNE